MVIWQDRIVASYVALLRGINVGGKNRIAMPELREIVAGLGHSDVDTYVQSGNVVFSSRQRDARKLAEAIEQAIARRLGIHPAVVVITGQQLARVVAHNPYPMETNPKCLHAVFRRLAMSSAEVAAVDDARRRAAEKGGRDEVTVMGSVLYLRTPDGLGRSDLAARLARLGASSPETAGTARNWTTVTALLALVDA